MPISNLFVHTKPTNQQSNIANNVNQKKRKRKRAITFVYYMCNIDIPSMLYSFQAHVVVVVAVSSKSKRFMVRICNIRRWNSPAHCVMMTMARSHNSRRTWAVVMMTKKPVFLSLRCGRHLRSRSSRGTWAVVMMTKKPVLLSLHCGRRPRLQ